MQLAHVKELEKKYLLGTYSRYELLADRGSGAEVTPFLLKRDAEQFADHTGGRVGTFNEALEAVTVALR